MKLSLRTWQLGLILLLSTLIPALATAALTTDPKPTPHHQQHTTQSDFWDAVRIRPVKVLAIEGHTVQYQFDDTHTVIVASVETDEYTKFPKDFKEGKNFILLYCVEHQVAYEFVPR
jgi:hypothetical protein